MPTVGKVEGTYRPHDVEEWVKRFWRENNIYGLIKKWRKGRKRFFFLDGPPYPSSDIPHAGTAWNKVLKDSILRYMRMRGYDVIDTPGYDCHGLPIEVAVEKRLGVKVKREIETKIGVDKFIAECKRLVQNNIRGLTHWFQELGVFMDWDNPYLTMTDEYIEAAWWLVKRAHEKGLLEQDYRVVYWCPRCGTTLAEYEVEYRDITDPSIYVKFRLKDSSNEYLLIWTTTPWTLPANAFVMAHPDALYVKVRVGKEFYILAKARLKHVMEAAGVKNYDVVEEFPGKKLEGLEYVHPLEDIVPLQSKLARYHKVVLAPEYVALHEGTGLVHAAPGHGFEDFDVARRIGMDIIIAPIDDEGKFTSEAGPYAGLYVRDANSRIINDLKERDALFHAHSISHRYPVCWRCKTPVVLRATLQWIIRVTKLKDRLREEVKKITWIPEWALDRIMAMIDGLQDWVLSRQRYWGTPLPIWVCERCGYRVVVGSVDELLQYGGRRPQELHKPWIDAVYLNCPKCGARMKRVSDVIDVWFDSGVAFYASRGHPGKTRVDYHVDFITEGHDQTRGWFFSLLRAGVIGFDEKPYHTVLVHGFMLDERGREMHKSLGNYVGTDEILAKAGRDVFRFWILQNSVWEDARFSWKALEQALSDLTIVWNVFVFASTYMSLDKYDPTIHTLEKYSNFLKPEDKWLLSRTQKLIKHVSEYMNRYSIHEAVRLLRDFIVEDVSHWYIRLIRRRVWVEEETPEKYAAYVTLYHALRTWLTLAAPFIPFLTEKLYQDFIKPAEPTAPPSVHMLDWPSPRNDLIDEKLELLMNIVREINEAAAAARMTARIKLRQPVRKIIVYTSSSDVMEAVRYLRELVLQATNAKDVEVRSAEMVEELVDYRVEPVYEVLGPTYKELVPKIVKYLQEKGAIVARDIVLKGEHIVSINGVDVVLNRNTVRIIPIYRKGYAVKETNWGSVAIDTTLSEEEIAEGIARDIVRRIQYMRKMLNLDVEEAIDVIMYVPEDHKAYVNKRKEFIINEVRARNLDIVDEPAKVKGRLVKEWEIDGLEYVIGVTPSAG